MWIIFPDNKTFLKIFSDLKLLLYSVDVTLSPLYIHAISDKINYKNI